MTLHLARVAVEGASISTGQATGAADRWGMPVPASGAGRAPRGPAVQYETIFDIDSARPSGFGGLIFGILFAGFFIAAGRGWLDTATRRARTNTSGQQPRSDRTTAALKALAILDLVVGIIAACGAALAPNWRWGVAIGALMGLFSLREVILDVVGLEHLRNATPVEVVEGRVTLIHAYATRSRRRRETLGLDRRLFDYGEHDAGSPYSLAAGYWPLEVGQVARVAVADDHVVRVERQLCLVYPRCTVWRMFGFRYESEAR